MIDFYTELNISKSSPVEDINRYLTQEESKWVRREATNPEKAIKMRALIIEARKVFETSATKAKYDRELAMDQKEPMPNPSSRRYESNSEQSDWYRQALSYFDNQEFDLAKAAIERALSQANPNLCNDELYSLAADIYYRNGDYQTALNYINKAIIDRRMPMHYILKAGICRSISLSRNYTGLDCLAECFKNLDTAISLANEIGMPSVAGNAYGIYAFWLYRGGDAVRAEEYARKAVSLGDNWGNADRVLKPIEAERRQREEAEKRKKEEEKRKVYTEAMRSASSQDIPEIESAIRRLQTISDYKDSAQQIQKLKEKIQSIKDKAEKEKAEKERKRKRTIKAISVVLPVLIVIVSVSLFVYNIQHHKCGDNLTWDYNEETRVLTISGSGPMYEYGGNDEDRHRPWEKFIGDIETVFIEDGCTRIGQYSFAYMMSLREVTLPDSVESIGDDAFSGNYLDNIQLPEGVISIEGSPFKNTALETLYIPASVESLDAVAYGINSASHAGIGITEINVDANNLYYTSVDGVLFNKDMTILWEYPAGKMDESYSIPDGVIEIRSDAFSWAENLRSVSIPESVTTLGQHSFSCCGSLVEINIPASVTSLPGQIFEHCGLTEISIPSHVREIGNSAFQNSQLIAVTIQNGTETIGDYAFFNCYDLTSITIPQSVKSIGRNAFADCGENAVIYYAGTESEWEAITQDAAGFDGAVQCLGDISQSQLVGTWYSEEGSILTLRADGSCHYGYEDYDGNGIWYVLDQYIYIDTDALDYEIYALLENGDQSTSLLVTADESATWLDEIFYKQ